MLQCLQRKQYEICQNLKNEQDLEAINELVDCVNQIYTAMGKGEEDSAGKTIKVEA